MRDGRLYTQDSAKLGKVIDQMEEDFLRRYDNKQLEKRKVQNQKSVQEKSQKDNELLQTHDQKLDKHDATLKKLIKSVVLIKYDIEKLQKAAGLPSPQVKPQVQPKVQDGSTKGK